MRQFKFESEAALAKEIVVYLRECGWDVYQEVSARGCAADIVAVWQNKIVWVIETKLSLNLTVLSQAWGWRRYAHYVSIGIPASAVRTKAADAGIAFLQDKGIGCLLVGQPGWANNVRTAIDCKLFRKALTHHITKQLCPELRDYKQAGSTEGHRYTPFRATCDKLIREVKEHPAGIGMKEAVERVQHHYSSPSVARKCLSDLCLQGYFKADFSYVKEGRSLILIPVVEKAHGA